MLFAVHPIHTEAVAAASDCSELMAMALMLGAWWLHLNDRPILAVVCFALAALAKESALAFVPLVVLGDYVRGRWKPFARYVSVAVTGLLYLVVLWNASGGRFGAANVNFLDNPLAHFPAALRIPNALRIASLRYFRYASENSSSRLTNSKKVGGVSRTCVA